MVEQVLVGFYCFVVCGTQTVGRCETVPGSINTFVFSNIIEIPQGISSASGWFVRDMIVPGSVDPTTGYRCLVTGLFTFFLRQGTRNGIEPN
jgi:hypothetical protein